MFGSIWRYRDVFICIDFSVMFIFLVWNVNERYILGYSYFSVYIYWEVLGLSEYLIFLKIVKYG